MNPDLNPSAAIPAPAPAATPSPAPALSSTTPPPAVQAPVKPRKQRFAKKPVSSTPATPPAPAIKS